MIFFARWTRPSAKNNTRSFGTNTASTRSAPPCSIVAGVAGYKGWTYWQEKQAQDAGTKFTQALALQDGADAAKARERLTALAEKGPAGYRVLARFQLAAAEAKAGDNDKAVADLRRARHRRQASTPS